MARKPMVTRSITSTKAVVLCLNTETCEPHNQMVILSRTYTDDAKLLKDVKEQIETEELKAVKIVSKEEEKKIYGLAENDFIAYATVLDENRKPVTE